MALLDYQTTPLSDTDLSPAQLLMGCQLRIKLPMMESLLQPTSNNQQEISRYLDKTKESQKKYHDRHASKDMKELQSGPKVRMQPWTNSKVWKPATVVKHHHTPRSYVGWRLKTAESIAATGDICEYAQHQGMVV